MKDTPHRPLYPGAPLKGDTVLIPLGDDGGGTIGQRLVARNRIFREALLQFKPRPAVFLLKLGYEPLPITKASDADALAADAIQITGELKRSTLVHLLPTGQGTS